jgi:arylsulfatase A-like enzyme
MEDAPDLVVIWHDYGYWGRARYGQNDLTLFQAPSTWDYSTLPLTGSHRPQGILIAVGPGIAKGQVVEKANLIDLTPTILSFLDVPVPTGFDGRTLNEMFTPPLKIEYQDADNQSGLNLNDHQFAKDEEELVMQHLKNLGYL